MVISLYSWTFASLNSRGEGNVFFDWLIANIRRIGAAFVCQCSSWILIFINYSYLGTAVAQWLRFCDTNRNVAGSIPDGVIGFLRWHNPSDRTMALGSTQPLTEMSTRSISCG
jgi:hypothetical protein